MVKTTLQIEGMACGMCESHINDAIRREFRVKKVTSSHTRGITEIISEEEPDEEALRRVIGQTGYTFVSMQSEPYTKKGFFFISFKTWMSHL